MHTYQRRYFNVVYCLFYPPKFLKIFVLVFDENRLTRDDFLGMIEIPLMTLPKEADNRVIPPKKLNLQPRSSRSKVKGYLTIYAAFIPDPSGKN